MESKERAMNLIRYNPNRWFEGMFGRAFEVVSAPRPVARAGVEREGWVPRVDIRESGDAIVLEAEIPGADRDALKLEVKGGVLTVSGEKRPEHTAESEGGFRAERTYGAFSRKCSLP